MIDHSHWTVSDGENTDNVTTDQHMLISLFLAVVQQCLDDAQRFPPAARWLFSKSFEHWVSLIGWPMSDYRIKRMQAIAAERMNHHGGNRDGNRE